MPQNNRNIVLRHGPVHGMVSVGIDLKRCVKSGDGFGQQINPGLPFGAGTLVFEGNAEIVLRSGSVHGMVSAGPELKSRVKSGDGIGQQIGPGLPFGAGALV